MSQAMARVTPAGPVRVAVTVLAGDAGLGGEVVAALTARQDLGVLATEWVDADVVVVLAELVTDAVVDELAAQESAGQRIVLVAGPLRERYLPQLFGAGVVSVLPYRGVTADQVVRAVLASSAGRAVVPDVLVRWLVDEVRSSQFDMLTSQGVMAGGLTEREVEVLRRLAEGYDTTRIASELNYSERTIKKIIQDVMSRLRLRNRAHAVSYAMRVGAI
ncbi:DNA-binding response regulator, NarL/FixJ family, contains REC and HTH domains [Lentzea waywayandensis]|uniref:DNA-binding response regulator, NarL/FixJ family, contains REC and HTH domains n=1 Tax=Lentzea waywayandensis TaxID=84724 RepID=A0A1I6FIZ9_9PSEU|nr:LuxR C-terminal-related transcriptional regulator [Lentzea waywayandensis]SFR29921.1 DNA-binding response regulator, NarL/FixJ family, contains REC and HTH domains [Lentzea waywayandensis]